jgi:hypothetical protein
MPNCIQLNQGPEGEVVDTSPTTLAGVLSPSLPPSLGFKPLTKPRSHLAARSAAAKLQQLSFPDKPAIPGNQPHEGW